MTTFLFAYRAAKDYQGTSGTAEEWRAWFESLGSDVEEIGNPVFERGSVGDTGSETVLGGYSLITADSLAAATELAKGCRHWDTAEASRSARPRSTPNSGRRRRPRLAEWPDPGPSRAQTSREGAKLSVSAVGEGVGALPTSGRSNA
jgi:hypothetical protein